MARRMEIAARESLLRRRRRLLRLLLAQSVAPRDVGSRAGGQAQVHLADAGRLGAMSIGLYRILSEISHAIDRIDRGCYGVCTDCGGAISPRFLEAVPWAARCVACEARLAGSER